MNTKISLANETVDPKEVTDLVVFHDRLNPKFWDETKTMKQSVRFHLLKSAWAFYEFLEIPDLKITDVIVCGSNASFNYTHLSDLDVHIVVNFKTTQCSDLIENLFTAKKTLWNSTHDISIKGQAVEMYVQNTDSDLESNGVYSLLKNEWVNEPSSKRPSWNDAAVVTKAEACVDEIENLLAGKPEMGEITSLLKRIHSLRRNGLANGGEFSTENLTYKVVRNLGYLDKLYDLKLKLGDAALSQE